MSSCPQHLKEHPTLLQPCSIQEDVELQPSYSFRHAVLSFLLCFANSPHSSSAASFSFPAYAQSSLFLTAAVKSSKNNNGSHHTRPYFALFCRTANGDELISNAPKLDFLGGTCSRQPHMTTHAYPRLYEAFLISALYSLTAKIW